MKHLWVREIKGVDSESSWMALELALARERRHGQEDMIPLLCQACCALTDGLNDEALNILVRRIREAIK